MFYELGGAQNINISKCCFHFVIGITMNGCTNLSLHFSLQMRWNSNHHYISAVFTKTHIKKLISEPDIYKSVISAHNDFFRYGNNKYDCWLFNPSWKVQQCLAILDINSGCNFLSCSDHNNGSKLYVIHPPGYPMVYILPTSTSDQLFYAVLQNRAVKPLKSTKYSTQFQMHE